MKRVGFVLFAVLLLAVSSLLADPSKYLIKDPVAASGSELLILQVESPGRFRLPDVVF